MSRLSSDVRPARLEFYDRMAERAQRRFLAAIRALAQVRRLQVHTLTQLNVATSQVNIAGAGSVE